MDTIDHRIVGALSRAARQTLQELAHHVHLGASATRERLRRLEAAGIITGYRAVLDADRLGFPFDALVEVDLPAGADAAAFEAGLRATPAVVEAVHATGDRDYLVRLRCRDKSELNRVVHGLKRELGAARTETRVVLDQPVPARDRLPDVR
ncbi:Lrp/AsnC family transcriptional regulator [Egicoccus sp. AB-alg2]|uniref:Lrp/AsnC family transcriptional regulator n=1 Tax=Egicoccus sp. AB-alg2 TaxID=3242693 RepID=UPI00359EDCFA